MIISSTIKRFAPARMLDAIRRRGLKGALYHGLRRLGCMSGRVLTGPAGIRINPLAVTCNHRCPMCWIQHLEPDGLSGFREKERSGRMQLEDYIRLFRELPAGLEYVDVVGGGEPLLHPQAAEILEEIKRLGVSGSLITNGSLLREDLAYRMIAAGWDRIRVSVNAGNAQVYKAIHGVDHFDLVRSNLIRYNEIRQKLGKRKQCKIMVFHVVQRDNLDSIDELFQVAEEVGADFIEFDLIIPYDEEKRLSPEQLKAASEALRKGAERCSIPCNLDEVLPEASRIIVSVGEGKPFVPARYCSVGYDEAFITSTGEVLTCCFSSECVGVLREQSFSSIWHSPRYADFRKRLMAGKFANYCIVNQCSQTMFLHK